MKEKYSEKENRVTWSIATHIASIIDIYWDTGKGRIRLEDEVDKDGNHLEVDCRFLYRGQHWIWNRDAYTEEDAASHSAYAFWFNDRVIAVQRRPYTDKDPAKCEQDEDGDGWIYEVVAVQRQAKDPVTGGLLVDADGNPVYELDKRKVWPLFRLQHDALLVGVEYEGLAKHVSFPFIDYNTRELINPYTDQQGKERPLGTPGSISSPYLVITKEQHLITQADGTKIGEVDGNGNPVYCYIPHAMHEFFEPYEISHWIVRPDVMCQTVPNWRGRVIGISVNDEILIDNVPIAKVKSLIIPVQYKFPLSDRYGNENLYNLYKSQREDIFRPTPRNATSRIVCIDTVHEKIIIIYVTMDYNHVSWLADTNSLSTNYFYVTDTIPNENYFELGPPKYPYFAQIAEIDLKSVDYYGILRGDVHVPEVEMVFDEGLSVSFEELCQFLFNRSNDSLTQGDSLYAIGNNLNDQFAVVGNGGKTKDFCMTLSYIPIDDDINVLENLSAGVDYNIKLSEEGELSRELVHITPYKSGLTNNDVSSSFTKELYEKYPDGSGSNYKDGYYTTNNAVSTLRPVEDVIALVGENIFSLSLTGRSSFQFSIDQWLQTYERVGHKAETNHNWGESAANAVHSDTQITYNHKSSAGDFEICTVEQRWENGVLDFKIVIFTYIDVKKGIYGFWDVSFLENTDAAAIITNTFDVSDKNGDAVQGWIDADYAIIWKHYIKSAKATIKTHEYTFPKTPLIVTTSGLVPNDNGNGERSALCTLFAGADIDGCERGLGPLGIVLPQIDNDGNSRVVKTNKFVASFGHAYWYINRVGRLRKFPNVKYDGISKLFALITGHHGPICGYTPYYGGTTEHPFQLLPISGWHENKFPHTHNTGRPKVTQDTLFDLVQSNNGWTGRKLASSCTVYEITPYLSAIFCSDDMAYTGITLNDGNFILNVTDGKRTTFTACTPEMEKMRTCTGRNDAIFSLE